jgi:hypothetical protein
LARQLERAMQKQHKTKLAMARELHTSRSQLDRLLDPANVSVSLDTIARAVRPQGQEPEAFRFELQVNQLLLCEHGSNACT